MVTHLNVDIKRFRDLSNRIIKFERQLSLHYNELHYYPTKAKNEIARLRKMQEILSHYDLINNNIKFKKIQKELNSWGKYKEHWIRATGLDWIEKKRKLTRIESIYLRNLEEKSVKARKYELLFRLRLELEEAIHSGWFVIMNTLTTDVENYDRVWSSNSTAFKDYIKRFDKISGKENHNYFGVIELGEQTGRYHYHVIHMLKEIPGEWHNDPNFNENLPVFREIQDLKRKDKWWNYGFSSPIAVRIHASDAWAGIGYRWPVKVVNNCVVPLETGSGAKLANYVSKYLTKSLEHKGDLVWKPRKRNQMGMKIVNNAFQNLTSLQVSQLMKIVKMRVLKIHNQPVPSQMLMMASHKLLLKILKKSKNITQLMSMEPQSSVMKRLQNLMTSPQTYNLETFGNSQITDWNEMEISEIQSIQNELDYWTYHYTGFVAFNVFEPLAGNIHKVC